MPLDDDPHTALDDLDRAEAASAVASTALGGSDTDLDAVVAAPSISLSFTEATAQVESLLVALRRPGVHADEAGRLELLCKQAERQASRWGGARLDWTRELGQYLERTPRLKSRRRKESGPDSSVPNLPSLAELGIKDRHLAANAVMLAQIADDVFAAYREGGGDTFEGALRFARERFAGSARPHANGKPRYMKVWGRSVPAASRAPSASELDDAIGEWLTPPEIFTALDVQFDLDVCSPGAALCHCPAKRHYTKADNGLIRPWFGFIWMNAPFGLRNGIELWTTKFVEHGNGVCLVPDFTSTVWFQRLVDQSDSALFCCPKVQFLPRIPERSNTLGSVLVAIGERGVRALENAKRVGRGTMLDVRH